MEADARETHALVAVQVGRQLAFGAGDGRGRRASGGRFVGEVDAHGGNPHRAELALGSRGQDVAHRKRQHQGGCQKQSFHDIDLFFGG